MKEQIKLREGDNRFRILPLELDDTENREDYDSDVEENLPTLEEELDDQEFDDCA